MGEQLSSGLPLDLLPEQINEHSFHYQPDRVANLVKSFLDDLEWAPTGINPVNKPLEDFMLSVMHTRGIECKQLKRTVHLAAALVELGCHECTLEEKKYAALFNWFSIYIDDKVAEDPIPFREFGPRLLRRQPQLDPVLNVFTEVLDRMLDKYDPLIGTSMLNSLLGFMTGCCIEPELENLPLVQGGGRFSEYIRNLTGHSIAYTLFAFTKRDDFNLLQVVQALPDMNFWTNVTNDLLSFHKEETSGETNTYVCTRAKNGNKSTYEVLDEIFVELRESRQAIHAALADNPAALKIWKTWERGYVEWHLIQERYHLKDLGIGTLGL